MSKIVGGLFSSRKKPPTKHKKKTKNAEFAKEKVAAQRKIHTI